ncbi:MAG: ice-binding family protein [Mucilaginibacter sp.]
MSKKLKFTNMSAAGHQNPGYLKPLAAIFSLVALLFVFSTGCQKDASNPSPNQALSSNDTLGQTTDRHIIFAPVNLRTAGNFTILTETGISTTGVTSIVGNIGVSPIAATAITGFGLIKDASGQFSHTPIVVGRVYAANYTAPTPSNMTTAVNDMKTAFTTANGMTFPAPVVNAYAGNISGRTLSPGVYKWSTGVLVSNVGVTLSGTSNDVWVFQIAQNLTLNNAAIITLRGGALAKNVFWVVSGKATLGTTVNFSGNILSKTLISLNTNANVKGKLLAQTAVTLIANSVHP